jgi:hypothetical protein
LLPLPDVGLPDGNSAPVAHLAIQHTGRVKSRCPRPARHRDPSPTLLVVDLFWRSSRRQMYVAMCEFPPGLDHGLRRRYPRVHSVEWASRGLRQWLRLQVVAKEILAMPSLAVDQLWHEFFLHTAAYAEFCAKAYGRKLNYHSEGAMSNGASAKLDGAAVAYIFALACEDEYIPAHQPDRLPVLFSVDRKVGVPTGQRWEVGCDGDSCQVAGGSCVRHQLVPLIPDRLPKVLPLKAANRVEVRRRTAFGLPVSESERRRSPWSYLPRGSP